LPAEADHPNQYWELSGNMFLESIMATLNNDIVINNKSMTQGNLDNEKMLAIDCGNMRRNYSFNGN
jgi:hypothetical protein